MLYYICHTSCIYEYIKKLLIFHSVPHDYNFKSDTNMYKKKNHIPDQKNMGRTK